MCEGEKWWKQACVSLIDSRFEESKNNNEMHSNFRDIIIKQQEKEKREPAQREIVEVIQQKQVMVRNIAERKRSVLLSGLREDNIIDWKKGNKKEEEKIRNLLNKWSEEGDVFSKVDYMRLRKYEEG